MVPDIWGSETSLILNNWETTPRQSWIIFPKSHETVHLPLQSGLEEPNQETKALQSSLWLWSKRTREQGQEDAPLHSFSGHVVLEKLLHLSMNLLSLINPMGIVDIGTFYVFVKCLVKWAVIFDVKCSGQKRWEKIKKRKLPAGDGYGGVSFSYGHSQLTHIKWNGFLRCT